MADYTYTCGCGRALLYVNPDMEAAVLRLIAEHGDTVAVTAEATGDTFRVPRHFIALHGLKAARLPFFAAKFGWDRIN